jgi:hypothetical protein
MLDVFAEQAISLAEVAKVCGRGRKGKPCHFSTVLRWILGGVRGPAGDLVKLEAIRLGGRWVTTQGAFQRFVAKLTPNSNNGGEAPEPVPVRSPAARQRSSERAAKKLEAGGIR